MPVDLAQSGPAVAGLQEARVLPLVHNLQAQAKESGHEIPFDSRLHVQQTHMGLLPLFGLKELLRTL